MVDMTGTACSSMLGALTSVANGLHRQPKNTIATTMEANMLQTQHFETSDSHLVSPTAEASLAAC